MFERSIELLLNISWMSFLNYFNFMDGDILKYVLIIFLGIYFVSNIWIVPVHDYQSLNQLHRSLLHRLDHDFLDDVLAEKIIWSQTFSCIRKFFTEPPSMTIDLCDLASEITEWASSSSRFFLSCLIRRYILKRVKSYDQKKLWYRRNSN